MIEAASRRLASAVFAVTLGFVVVVAVLALLNRTSMHSDDVFLTGVTCLSILVYGAVGVLIARRQPRNTLGWGFLVFAVGLGATLTTSQYAARALIVAPGSLPFGTLAAWIQVWLAVPPVSMIIFVFLLFPTGRVPSRRWRPILWLAAAATIGLALGWAFKPGPINQSFGDFGQLTARNPVGIGHPDGILDAVLIASIFAALIAGACAIASLVVRFRSATGEERQQIRWLAYVGGAAVALFFFNVLTGLLFCSSENDHGACQTLGNFGFLIFFLVLALGIPVACGISILRYRLWDLDVVIKKTLVFGFLVVLVMVVFISVVAFTAGGIIGGIVIALLFQPMRERARRLADRIVYGKRATPYEVLTEFSGRMAETYATDDVLPRMAEILAGATGARAARVWLRVGQELRVAASSPEGSTRPAVELRGDALPGFAPGEHAVEVRHQGELLGALSVETPPNDPMTPARERLVHDLASQAGLVLRNVRLIAELRESRRRIVTGQDARAKALERNIHDGAQQQLVALSVKLRLAEQGAERDPASTKHLLAQLQGDATDALENLRDLARGIYPPLLADKGLPSALEAQARKSLVSTTVEADGVGRHAADVESAIYFSCLEALQNVAKYARASNVKVALAQVDGELTFAVTDDGQGFDPDPRGYGTGLQGIADRLEAIGGRLEVESARGAGTTIKGSVPVSVRNGD